MRIAKRMRLTIEHVFEGIAVADYETLFFDEPFNEAIGRDLHMGRQLLRFDRGDKRIVRHVCYEPARKPGDAINEVFGSSRASFVEELEYDVVTRRATWRTIPNLWAERVRTTGTIELAAVPGGTRRVVSGEVKVSLFGFGRLVERMIVAEIEKSYGATAAFTRAWLAR